MRFVNLIVGGLGWILLGVFAAEMFRAWGMSDLAIIIGALGIIMRALVTRPQVRMLRIKPVIEEETKEK